MRWGGGGAKVVQKRSGIIFICELPPSPRFFHREFFAGSENSLGDRGGVLKLYRTRARVNLRREAYREAEADRRVGQACRSRWSP